MKVRIQGNSLRFRLKQFEVEAFKETHFIKEETVFSELPSMQLQFILSVSSVPELKVNYDPGQITVFIPQPIAGEWTTTELVGIEESVTMPSGRTINVLIEKDFKCLDGREEENIGSYPNPLATN